MIAGGKDELKTNYTAALKPFQQTFDNAATGTGQQGYQAWADATGANGPEGLARAKALFTANPGFTTGINLTLDQNDRRRAARGELASGGTDVDTTKLATDYSNLKYGDYTSRLAPFSAVPGQMQSAAGGIANVNTGLGNQLNANDLTLADLFNKGSIATGNANANADMARLTAGANQRDAIMSIAKLLMGGGGLPGGGGGGGGGGFFDPAKWNATLPAGDLIGV